MAINDGNKISRHITKSPRYSVLVEERVFACRLLKAPLVCATNCVATVEGAIDTRRFEV